MNRKDLRALTLEGPPRENPELDPLAVLHIDNRLLIYIRGEINKLFALQVKCVSQRLRYLLYISTSQNSHIQRFLC